MPEGLFEVSMSIYFLKYFKLKQNTHLILYTFCFYVFRCVFVLLLSPSCNVDTGKYTHVFVDDIVDNFKRKGIGFTGFTPTRLH